MMVAHRGGSPGRRGVGFKGQGTDVEGAKNGAGGSSLKKTWDAKRCNT